MVIYIDAERKYIVKKFHSKDYENIDMTTDNDNRIIVFSVKRVISTIKKEQIYKNKYIKTDIDFSKVDENDLWFQKLVIREIFK